MAMPSAAVARHGAGPAVARPRLYLVAARQTMENAHVTAAKSASAQEEGVIASRVVATSDTAYKGLRGIGQVHAGEEK